MLAGNRDVRVAHSNGDLVLVGHRVELGLFAHVSRRIRRRRGDVDRLTEIDRDTADVPVATLVAEIDVDHLVDVDAVGATGRDDDLLRLEAFGVLPITSDAHHHQQWHEGSGGGNDGVMPFRDRVQHVVNVAVEPSK